MASNRLKCVAAVAALMLNGSIAAASPPVNFSGEGLVKADLDQTIRINSERIKFQTKDPVDTYEVKLVWGANSSSGWHHHPGMVLVQVQSGLVDVTRLINGQCVTTQYGVGSPNGSTFTEGETEHVGTSVAGAVAYATAIVGNDEAARIEDDPPACATAPGIRTPKH